MIEYDLYGYMEDDLVIHDPLFFDKIFTFRTFLVSKNCFFPIELNLKTCSKYC